MKKVIFSFVALIATLSAFATVRTVSNNGPGPASHKNQWSRIKCLL